MAACLACCLLAWLPWLPARARPASVPALRLGVIDISDPYTGIHGLCPQLQSLGPKVKCVAIGPRSGRLALDKLDVL